MRAKLFIASGALAAMMWAVPGAGAAHFLGLGATANVNTAVVRPAPARFRVERERGLLLRVWINNGGPYVFAVDTGAGMNVIAQRVVTAAGLTTRTVPTTMIGGLSNARSSSSREAIIDRIALDERTNTLPSKQRALVVTNLPADLDGILDPTEAYAPFGYSIDLPNEQMEALPAGTIHPDTRLPDEGAIVPWVRMGNDNRPFVRLADGRSALVDTGSGFGLAVNGRDAVIVGRDGQRRTEAVRDIGGGTVVARRVDPTTINIGGMELRRIPTDLLFGVDRGAPVILGRAALRPFKISFDPQRRLIQFLTVPED
ncbi:MAG TPA: pepsin/retropepsin-like aspartic protease family protein [Pyrinomonadaceae bacterium]|nr:pepsin/retropepsin-like aspartic protease family protein [Pyrinomonadaceae bacterium]